MYKDILTDNNIAMSLRRRVYNQCILTTMTYGAETWTTTNELNNKLITTQRAMERKMVHLTIRDKVNHNKIREKTKVKDIIEKIKETKWRWAGHVLRVQDNRWTRRLTEWQPRTGKRKRGRQKKRWRDDITAHMGTATWTRVARERETNGSFMRRALSNKWMNYSLDDDDDDIILLLQAYPFCTCVEVNGSSEEVDQDYPCSLCCILE